MALPVASHRSSLQGQPAAALRKDSNASARSRRSSAASVGFAEEECEQSSFVSTIMQHDALRAALEMVFYCVLDGAGHCDHHKTSVAALKDWCLACQLYADPEIDRKQSEVDSSHLMTAVEFTMGYPVIAGDVHDLLIDFTRFVSIMGHLGCSRYKVSRTEPLMVTDAIYNDYLVVWMVKFRQAHTTSGLQPLAEFQLITRSIDRIFYEYLTPMQNVMRRQAAGKLGLDLQDVTQVCQDYLGAAPISRSCIQQVYEAVRAGPPRNTVPVGGGAPPPQQALLGMQVVVPGEGGQQQEESSPAAGGEEGDDVAPAAAAAAAAAPAPELLSLHGFMEFLARVAQVIFQKTAQQCNELPSVHSRLSALIRAMEPAYATLMDRSMSTECVTTLKGIPDLSRNALAPSRCAAAGGSLIAVVGSNFCTRRAVYVRLTHTEDKSRAFLLEAEEVRDKRLTFVSPPVSVERVHVTSLCDIQTHVWTIDIDRRETYALEASNDGFDFSVSEAPQVLCFQEKCPPWVMPDPVAEGLQKAFALSVSYRDRRNTRFMTLDRWKQFKQTYGLLEGPQDTSRVVKPAAAGDDPKSHPFFDEVAVVQVLPPKGGRDGDPGIAGLRSEPSVDFKAFIRLMCKCTALVRREGPGGEVSFEYDAANPAVAIPLIVEDVLQREGSRVEIAVDDILHELKLTRDAISLIERRAQRELDVYVGPVLCATVADRPGLISSQRTNLHRRHQLLTCTTYDCFLNNESVIAGHCFVADTFDHLLRRLLTDGFDLAAPTDPATRQPAGRCWHVYSGDNRIGALWDLPGHFSSHYWQPTSLDAASSSVTMTVYKKHDDLDYVVCFMQFLKADSPARMRRLLTQRGFTLRTTLYKKL